MQESLAGFRLGLARLMAMRAHIRNGVHHVTSPGASSSDRFAVPGSTPPAVSQLSTLVKLAGDDDGWRVE